MNPFTTILIPLVFLYPRTPLMLPSLFPPVARSRPGISGLLWFYKPPASSFAPEGRPWHPSLEDNAKPF